MAKLDKRFITLEVFRAVMALPIHYRHEHNEVGLPTIYRDKEKTTFGGCRLNIIWNGVCYHKTVNMETLLKYFPETYFGIKKPYHEDKGDYIVKTYFVKEEKKC